MVPKSMWPVTFGNPGTFFGSWNAFWLLKVLVLWLLCAQETFGCLDTETVLGSPGTSWTSKNLLGPWNSGAPWILGALYITPITKERLVMMGLLKVLLLIELICWVGLGPCMLRAWCGDFKFIENKKKWSWNLISSHLLTSTSFPSSFSSSAAFINASI